MTLILGILLLVLTGWVANDAARRHRQWFGWAALVWFTNIIGLVVWIIVRRRSPVVGDRPNLRRNILIAAAASVPLLLVSILLQVVIVTFFFQSTRNVGAAMEPTLEDQERLIINKSRYRLADPRPGEVVMMYYPLDPSKAFVKRVIAQPGDTIRISDGRVYVNDTPLKDDYVSGQFRSHDDWGPQVIPQGYYFVLGDHRNNSSDSRHFGYVPKKYNHRESRREIWR